MPNWCEGTLKVRGTKENVTKFILEGLQPVGFLGEEKGKLTLNKYGDIESDETCWIENTRRGFVDKPDVFLSNYEDGEIAIAVFDARFAWGIDATQLQKTCIKYNVDIGFKVQALWGDSNLGSNNIVILLSNHSQKITTVMLNKNANGEFDGTYKVLETVDRETVCGVQGADIWGDTLYIHPIKFYIS